MKIICNREILLNYLNITIKAVGNKTPQPILDCILITANEEGLFMTATNLDLSIKTSKIPSNIITEGEIAIDAKFFNDIMRRLDAEEVTISLDDMNQAVNISCGRAKYNIMSQKSESFPTLPSVNQDKKYQISQNELKNMLRQTIFSIATDISKPIFTGELFQFENSSLKLVSVDGYRISYRNNTLISADENDLKEVIVMGKTVQELLKILSSEEDDIVNIYVQNDHILFDVGSAFIYSRVIDGDFIKYQQSFTNDCSTEVVIQKNQFLQCLDRASLIARDDKKTPVIFSIKDNILEITAKSEIGTTFEEISCEVEGDDMIIGFNPKYFKDALRVIDDENVKIKFIAPLSPCTILPVEGDEYKYLVLPIRI